LSIDTACCDDDGGSGMMKVVERGGGGGGKYREGEERGGREEEEGEGGGGGGVKKNRSITTTSILTTVFRSGVFVGFVSTELFLFQSNTSLYICNICAVVQEYLYQQLIMGCGHFLEERKVIQLQPPINLRNVLRMGVSVLRNSPAGRFLLADEDVEMINGDDDDEENNNNNNSNNNNYSKKEKEI
jgi:hypothetical protein